MVSYNTNDSRLDPSGKMSWILGSKPIVTLFFLSILAFVMMFLLLLIMRMHSLPFISSEYPAVTVQCEDDNLLCVAIKNRSTEAIYLPSFRFAMAETIPMRYFQINSNITTNTNTPCHFTSHIRESAWKPAYDKIQIKINYSRTSRAQLPIHLRKLPVGFNLKKIPPNERFVEYADLSDYIGDAKSRGTVSFSYTLTVYYLKQKDLDKSPQDKESSFLSNFANQLTRLLEAMHIKQPHGPEFGPARRKIEIIDELIINKNMN